MSQKVIFQTKITQSASKDLEGVGRLREIGDKTYRWVYNEHSAAIIAGDVVHHDLTNGNEMLQSVSDGAAASSLAFMAGIVSSTSIATLNWGWVLIQGYYGTALISPGTNATIAGGATLIGKESTLVANCLTAVALGTAPTHTKNLILLAEVGDTTTLATLNAAVYVNCLG